MAEHTIDKIEYNSNVYKLQDNVSGYITGISSSDVTAALGYTPLSSTSTLDATKLSGTIPSGCYTDTTYTRGTATSGGTDLSLVNTGDMYIWNNKQDALVSDTNIKTINHKTILGSGNRSTWVYCTCATAADTANKVASVATGYGFDSHNLEKGVQIVVKFTYANSTSNPTLNVSNTGAIAIKRYGTTAPSTSAKTSWQAGSCILFVYDGTYWQMCNWLNNDTTYSEISEAKITDGTGSTTGTITGRRAKAAVEAFAPVTSVNGSTGAVTLAIPTNISQLTNDSGYATIQIVRW